MAWNGSDSKKVEGKRPETKRRKGGIRPSVSASNFNYKALVAGAIVVLGGAAAWWLLTDDGGAIDEEKDAKATMITEVEPQIVTNRVVEKAEEVKPTNRNVRMEHGVEVVRANVTTNKNGAVIERLWLADGTTKRKINPPKHVFENPSDQLIAMALSAKPGQSMPPLPGLSDVDADFAKAMLSPIRIEEGDSDEVKDLKARVMEVRAYLAEEVKNGGTVQEALRQYQADMEKYADSHLMAVQQIQEIRQTDGEEAAREFRDRVNEAFRARGIPELETPESDTDTQKQEEE